MAARRISLAILLRAGVAFAVQLIGVVFTYWVAGLSTHAVLIFYYPACLFVAATGWGWSLPAPYFYVLWVPGIGMLGYSLVIGMLWAAMDWARGRISNSKPPFLMVLPAISGIARQMIEVRKA